MIASKVTFSKETRLMLSQRPMNRTAKNKLRTQRVFEFIREQVGGEAQIRDLIFAAGYDADDPNQYGTGWSFIKRLVRDNIITQSDGSDPKNGYIKQWAIPSDVHVVQEAVREDPAKLLPIKFKDQPAEEFVAAPVEGEDLDAVAQEIPEELRTPTRPARIVLDYAQKVSEAAETLKGYTNLEELNAYRSGLHKAIELLQDKL